MERTKIFKLLQSETPAANVLLKGWIRTRRDSKSFSFLEVNDGSCLKNIQVIANDSLFNYDRIKKLTTDAMMIPISPMNMNCPIEVRSRLVIIP